MALRALIFQEDFMNKPTRPLLPGQWASLGAVLLALAWVAPAAQGAQPQRLSGPALAVVEQFLAARTAGMPGKVQISIDAPASGSLPSCDALEAFLPGGASLRGLVSVGLRCNGSPRWTRYVQARIAVVGSYLAATRQIEAGETLKAGDTAVVEGDMAALPASVVVDASQLTGKVALNRIASGAPVRREQLQGISLVRQGQTVKVVSRGDGFMVSTEGKALTSAEVGAQVQVKLQGGPLVSGRVAADASVERSN